MIPIIEILGESDKKIFFYGIEIDKYILSNPSTLILIFALTFLIKSLLHLYIIFKQNSILKKLIAKISSKLFANYLQNDVSYFSKNNSNLILRNLTTETSNLNLLFQNLTTIIIEGIILISILIILIIINPTGTLVILIFSIILFLIISKLFFKKIFLWGKTKSGLDGEINKEIREGTLGIKEIKVFKKTKSFISRFEKLKQRYGF